MRAFWPDVLAAALATMFTPQGMTHGTLACPPLSDVPEGETWHPSLPSILRCSGGETRGTPACPPFSDVPGETRGTPACNALPFHSEIFPQGPEPTERPSSHPFLITF